MQNFFSKKSEQTVLTEVIMILSVLVFMSYFYYGLRVIIVVFISISSCYLTDIICCKLNKKHYKLNDLSAISTGLILALMMPASIPYEIMIFASCFAIVIGKQVFGGKGKNVFVPAAVGFILSSFCWKEAVLMYPKPGEALPLASHVSTEIFQSFTQNLNIAKIPSVSDIDIFLGKFSGPMGATHIFILIIAVLILLFRRDISLLVFLTALSTITVFAFFFPKFGNSQGTSVLYELTSGMVIFGLIFISCDYFTVPKNRSSRFLYGLIIGLLTVLLRRVGNTENPILFATIIANPIGISLDISAISFSELFDKYVKLIKEKRQKNNAEKNIKQGKD